MRAEEGASPGRIAEPSIRGVVWGEVRRDEPGTHWEAMLRSDVRDRAV